VTDRLVIVGVPGDKRTSALLAAAARAGVDARCVAWADALTSLDPVASAGDSGDRLRVESPGADGEIWHRLARLGGDHRPREAGEWRPGRGWFAGLTSFLTDLDRQTAALRPSHPSPQLLAMTDKLVCQQRLASRGVPVPELLPAPDDGDQLREIMRDAGCSAVFVKPRWGSSGAGVVAFRRDGRGHREQVTTTADLVNGRLFNRKRLRRYTRRNDIDAVLDTVLGDGAVVQRWLPKLGVADGPLDLRVVVIAGRAAQVVGRVGRGTITNLHLDARRMAIDELRADLGAAVVARVLAACEQAAACFPGHQSIGVDAMIDVHGRPIVLECNAWGDFLPRLLIDGMDCYDLYLRSLFGAARQRGSAS
jgi:hypothetical protein